MEKIEFIQKKETPSKFRAIINVNESYNVGITLNKTDMKGIFYQIKQLLEERTELNEPEFAKPKKKVIIQEVDVEINKQSVVEYLQNVSDEESYDIYKLVFPDDQEVVVLMEDTDPEMETLDPTPVQNPVISAIKKEKQVETEVEQPAVENKKKRGFLGLWSTLVIVGGGITYGVMKPEILDSIKVLFGM